MLVQKVSRGNHYEGQTGWQIDGTYWLVDHAESNKEFQIKHVRYY